ncbi:MAG: transketolase family protein [Promethearchaeota archaeon]
MTEFSLRDVFGDFLVEYGKIENRLVVLDSDLSSSTRTFKFAQKYPDRFFNMGIAEQNTLGSALGFAISGKIPIVSGFSIFTTGRAWEFIRLACHDNLNVKIVATHGGFVGEDGSTHNALEDFSLMSILPNMSVLVPLDHIELKEMLKFAIQNHGPFYMRLPRGATPQIHDSDYKFELGRPEVIKEGNEIGLIGTGFGGILACQSAGSLEKELGVSLKIINLSSIKPININELKYQVKDLKGIIVIEEHNLYCGVGSIIARILSEDLNLSMRFIGIQDSFGQSGKREVLLDKYGLNFKTLKEKIKSFL